MTRRGSGRPVLDWTIDVALVTEPLLLAGHLRVMVISGVIMAALLAFLSAVTGNTDGILPMLGLVGIVFVVVMIISLVAAGLVMRNRHAMRFVVDDQGVRQFSIDRRAAAASTAAIVAGALAGSPGTAGAGLLARAQAQRSAAWTGIASVRRHPARRAIALSNAWRTVMLVFCTAENYEAVAARVDAEMAAHRGRQRIRANPLPGLLLRTLVVVATSLPFFVLPYPFERDIFVPILTMAFGLAALWLVPHLGVVTIGGLAWMWVEIAMRAEDVSILSRPDRWGPLAVTAVATVVLVGLIVALIRGRVASGLTGDEEELEIDDGGDADD
mgnify:CR=1 FL=1